MADGLIDPGLAIVIATGFVAMIYLALAVWNFSRQRTGIGAARLFAAVLFGAVSLFVAFHIRLF